MSISATVLFFLFINGIPTHHHFNQRGIYLPRFDSAVLEDVVTSVCNEDMYHYGFNGKSKDNEWAGVGNHLDYGMRQYDTRICRPLSPDPLFKQFPNLSSYQFFSNTPIWATDLDGMEAAATTAWGAIGKQLGARGNGAAAAKDYTDNVIIPIAKQLGKEAAIFVGAEVGGEILEPLLFGRGTFFGDAIRVERPVIQLEKEVNLEARANEINSTLDPYAQSRRTTAVADATTADGNNITLVASSQKTLAPVQRAALKPGEVAVSGEGHAEITILDYANKNNMTVNKIAASRPICDDCAAGMQKAGASPASPLKSAKPQPVPVDSAIPGLGN